MTLGASIHSLADALAAGTTSSETLTREALGRIDDSSGEGKRVYREVFRDAALAEAQASDAKRAAGIVPSVLSGLPISIKDLFDVAGKVTLAGSVARDGEPVAKVDAPIVARLRAAGAVIMGRTTMTEFAFSGIGINPHTDTPRNPWDRETGRIPGGSSAGAAVSVTDGMAAAAIGTDTGGSVRIPAGLCGLAGFKPTARRVPLAGAFPLSGSQDSIGPLAPTLACCRAIDQVMAGEAVTDIAPMPIEGLRLAVPQHFVLEDLDETVSSAFSDALTRLSKAGAAIIELPLAELLEIPKITATGGLVAAEANAIYRELLSRERARFDPRVATRIDRGAAISAADYIDTLEARADLCRRVSAITSAFDAVVLPTTAIAAPPLAPLETDDALFHTQNMLMLRNTNVGNFLDRCAATVPCHAPGEAPVGFMIMGETMGDDRLISVATAIETVLGG